MFPEQPEVQSKPNEILLTARNCYIAGNSIYHQIEPFLLLVSGQLSLTKHDLLNLNLNLFFNATRFTSVRNSNPMSKSFSPSQVIEMENFTLEFRKPVLSLILKGQPTSISDVVGKKSRQNHPRGDNPDKYH
jgi:hypothetical protein